MNKDPKLKHTARDPIPKIKSAQDHEKENIKNVNPKETTKTMRHRINSDTIKPASISRDRFLSDSDAHKSKSAVDATGRPPLSDLKENGISATYKPIKKIIYRTHEEIHEYYAAQPEKKTESNQRRPCGCKPVQRKLTSSLSGSTADNRTLHCPCFKISTASTAHLSTISGDTSSTRDIHKQYKSTSSGTVLGQTKGSEFKVPQKRAPTLRTSLGGRPTLASKQNTNSFGRCQLPVGSSTLKTLQSSKQSDLCSTNSDTLTQTESTIKAFALSKKTVLCKSSQKGKQTSTLSGLSMFSTQLDSTDKTHISGLNVNKQVGKGTQTDQVGTDTPRTTKTIDCSKRRLFEKQNQACPQEKTAKSVNAICVKQNGIDSLKKVAGNTNRPLVCLTKPQTETANNKKRSVKVTTTTVITGSQLTTNTEVVHGDKNTKTPTYTAAVTLKMKQSNEIYNAIAKQANVKRSSSYNHSYENKFKVQSAEAGPSAGSSSLVVDRKNITVRKSLTPDAYNVSSDCEEIFINGENHCLTFETVTKKIFRASPIRKGVISPIKSNVHTLEETLIFQDVPSKPTTKKTLAHRMTKNRRTYYEDFPIHENLYYSEYLEEIMEYMLSIEKKYVLGKDFLYRHNFLTEDNRASIVNWLNKIQNYYQLPTSVFLIAVRLFDVILAATYVPKNMCQLVAMTTLWIINKYDNNEIPLMADKLSGISGAFSTKQILNMEQKLLKYFNFDCNIPDPTTYVTYYMKKTFKRESLLMNCTYYILESYTLSEDYSIFPPSLLAAAAFNLGLQTVFSDDSTWYRIRHLPAYYDSKIIGPVMKKMQSHFSKLKINDYECREASRKYSTEAKQQVSFLFK